MTVRVTELKRENIFFHWSTTYSQNRKQLLMHEQGVKCARSCIILFQDNSKQCSYNRDLFVYQMSEYLIQLYYLFMHPISLQIDFSNYVYLFSMMAYQNVFFTLKIGSYRCMTNLKFFAPWILVGWNILSRFIRFTRKFRHAVHFNGCFENFV